MVCLDIIMQSTQAHRKPPWGKRSTGFYLLLMQEGEVRQLNQGHLEGPTNYIHIS